MYCYYLRKLHYKYLSVFVPHNSSMYFIAVRIYDENIVRHGFIGQYHYQIIKHRVFHNRGNWFLHSSCLKSLFPEEEGHWTGFPFQALMELYLCAFPILFSLKIFTGNNNLCTNKRIKGSLLLIIAMSTDFSIVGS